MLQNCFQINTWNATINIKVEKRRSYIFQKYFITENGKNNIYISAIDIVFDYFKIMFPITLLRKKKQEKKDRRTCFWPRGKGLER